MTSILPSLALFLCVSKESSDAMKKRTIPPCAGLPIKGVTPPMLGNPLVSSSRTRRKFLRSVDFSIAYHIVLQKVSVLRAGPVQMSKNLCCAAIFSKFLEKNQVLSKFAEKSRVFSKIFGKKTNFVKI